MKIYNMSLMKFLSVFFLLSAFFVACEVPEEEDRNAYCFDCDLIFNTAIDDVPDSECGAQAAFDFEFLDGEPVFDINLLFGCHWLSPPRIFLLSPEPPLVEVDIFRYIISGDRDSLSITPFYSQDVEHMLELGFVVEGEICCNAGQ